MKELEPTWFAQEPLDFEHKKWILLAYTQEVQQNFQKKILFPYLSDLKYHLQNLEKWQNTRELYLKKELRGIDWENLTLLYDVPEDSPTIKELQQIIDWTYPRLQKVERIGRILWREIEAQMEVSYQGIWLTPEKEGKIILQMPQQTYIYNYTISEIIQDEPVKISLNLQETAELSYQHGWLIKTISIPCEETAIPIIKKNLRNWII